jgi:hypothetical protein
VVDELEAKIKECSSKGAEDVLLSQKATAAAGRRRTTANTPAGEKAFLLIPECSLIKDYRIGIKTVIYFKTRVNSQNNMGIKLKIFWRLTQSLSCGTDVMSDTNWLINTC